MPIIFKPNGTLNLAVDPSNLRETVTPPSTIYSEDMVRCKNLRPVGYGRMSLRDGISALTSSAVETQIHAIINIPNLTTLYIFDSTNVYIGSIKILQSMTNAQWYVVEYNAASATDFLLFATNGTDKVRLSTSAASEWGITLSTLPSYASQNLISISSGGLTGTYKFRATALRKSGSTIVYESNPGEISGTAVLSGHYFTGFFFPSDVTDSSHTVGELLLTHFRVYRTLNGGDFYYYDTELTIKTISGVTDGEIDNILAFGYTNVFEEWDSYISGTGMQITKTYDNVDYGYTVNWEKVGAFISGDGIDITVSPTSSDNDMRIQHDFEYDSGTALDHVWTRTTDWEPYSEPTQEFELALISLYATADSSHDPQGSRCYWWEPFVFSTIVADGSLGTQVETDHNRPPSSIDFLAGPFYNGIVFAIVGKNLYYCKPREPEYWPSTYYIEVSTEQSPGIALAFFNGILYFLTKLRIYQILGTAHGSFQPIDMMAICGTQNFAAVASVPGHGIYHVGVDGIYLFNVTDRKISNNILDPIFRNESANGVPGISDITNCWLVEYKNRLYFGYTSVGNTYPSNVIVMDIKDQRIFYYVYNTGSDLQLKVVFVDKTNDRFIAGDSNGNVWQIENSAKTRDNNTVISWELQTKNFALQTRKHFPRWVKYDVNGIATGEVTLDGVTTQTHAINQNRNTRRRLIDPNNGSRVSLKLSGTGAIDVYAIEAE